ncbi:cbb3-type cytochrome oxidase assembly protein CcoS [Marinobacter daepoensis]|uniref:Cbb3-type cytochrome oxidase assembly protein CcoS n=1 Tax=Marinobacter daepoensis TaxID=262077 RepID=A0ABS3BC97_9GAMM|nr:cbb3-type cytochrome oxidase assembly protein CcoS [Marinobacter daepoensis]MBN7769448.1 cbb3-type cytochrome oxidase assembly protein CcoS [Marinobacter daepoensis]MBY6031891.1 cbb3-type cytochrome oxidase assembly protein CcoS [Marinobacter daepoensis]MBY6078138.1 cbb3-type cytochrome oxidase assembly protein CcoS [Marinobacter daepoensis]
MQIVMILVPLMLLLVALGILLFSWAVKNGQYDDLDGPAHRILYDDDKDMIPEEARRTESEPESTEKAGEDSSAGDHKG